MSKVEYFVKHDVTLPTGQRLIGAFLTPPLFSRLQVKKALRKLIAKHPGAYCKKVIAFY